MTCNAAQQMHHSIPSLKWNKEKLSNLEKKGVQMSPMLHMKKPPEE